MIAIPTGQFPSNRIKVVFPWVVLKVMLYTSVVISILLSYALTISLIVKPHLLFHNDMIMRPYLN